MKSRWVLASSNYGKLREIQSILAAENIELINQDTLNIISPEETGSTFVENAIIKARHAARESGLPALADDSGLMVDALNGRPGVFSARYAGENATSEQRMQKLLGELDGQTNRRAQFCSVIVWVRHADDPLPLICQGVWEGEILHEPRGAAGFGYDPIFLVPDQRLSAAELEPAVKNRLSHRAKALSLLQQIIAARSAQDKN